VYITNQEVQESNVFLLFVLFLYLSGTQQNNHPQILMSEKKTYFKVDLPENLLQLFLKNIFSSLHSIILDMQILNKTALYFWKFITSNFVYHS
jgi:hypothetical protein